jgi:erythronate-4-phosphate dehydrogenase
MDQQGTFFQGIKVRGFLHNAITKYCKMIKVVADDKIPFLSGALEKVAMVSYLPGSMISREHLMDADALIVRTRTHCNEDLLKGTGVKFIATATIGYDHIDTQWCSANGITWTNAPGCNSGSVKQYIASALTIILPSSHKSFEELTLGIIGAGNVGLKVERMAHTLGMKVLVNDPPRERIEGSENFTPLETVLRESDIITMHTPFTLEGPDATNQMADTHFFSKMKKGSWFINTSRGEIAHTGALIDALKSRHLEGAIIDVWENEPAINIELMHLARIATPHIAGYSTDGKANGTAQSVQALSRFFNLGLHNWFPQNIPPAPQDHYVLSCQDKSREEIFCEISHFAYDIIADSLNLKSVPSSFEDLRGSYPVRREAENHTIIVNNTINGCRTFIGKLGYRTL